MKEYEVTIMYVVEAEDDEDAQRAARDYGYDNDWDYIVGGADIKEVSASTRRSYSKADVQWHSDGFRPSRPAVNVKHWPDFGKDVDWSEFGGTNTEFYRWLGLTDGFYVTSRSDGALEKYWEIAWQVACEDAWDSVQIDADESFRETAPNGNAYVKVWSEGRSDGWAVVDGLKDFESWDAIDLAAWRRFEKWAKQDSLGVAHYMIDFLYNNVWESVRHALSADAYAALMGSPFS